MTAKKGLKRLVRARMEATGELYTTALAAIRTGAGTDSTPRPVQPTPRPSLIEVQRDLTALARRAGIVCRAEVSERRWKELGDAFFERAFVRLRGLVDVLDGMPGAKTLRAAILHGAPPASAPMTAWIEFLLQLRAGVHGVGPSGHFAAVDVRDDAGETRLVFFALRTRAATLSLDVHVDPNLHAPTI